MQQCPQQQVDGVLLVDKAKDFTSHDVVAVARRAFNTKKIGHCGTLDPMATGLLILVLGRATKMQDLLMAEDKEYAATMLLGVETDSQDADGEVVAERPSDGVTHEAVRAAFERYRGSFDQIPPMVSAIKKNGVPLYKMARQGKTVEREPRSVRVDGYELTRIELPEVDFTVRCSKGFYVRTYAHDIGRELGCGAHLTALRRTRSGLFSAEGAVKVDALKNAPRGELLKSLLTIEDIARLRGVA